MRAVAACTVAGAALAGVGTAQAASDVSAGTAAAAAGWHSEALPGPAIGPLSLSFDATGHGLLTGTAVRPEQPRRPGSLPEGLYVAADRFDSTAGWRPAPNPPIASTATRTYLYGDGRAEQIGSEAVLVREKPYELHFRVLYADGTAEGVFGAPRVLDPNGDLSASAADAAGDTIVAWAHAKGTGNTVRVAERVRGGRFTRPRAFAGVGYPQAVALDPHGDRVLAWYRAGGLYARVRRAGRRWGPVQLAARIPAAGMPSVAATISSSGTVVLAWETVKTCEECASTVRAGVALQGARSRWKSFPVEHARLGATAEGIAQLTPRIIPLSDSSGRIYVAWNSVRHDKMAVEWSRVAPSGESARTTLSAPASAAVLDDAASGPRNRLVVAWSDVHYTPSGFTVYASLRPGGAPFEPPVKVTPETAPGSALAAFQPLTGAAVVVSAAITNGAARLQASLSPAG